MRSEPVFSWCEPVAKAVDPSSDLSFGDVDTTNVSCVGPDASAFLFGSAYPVLDDALSIERELTESFNVDADVNDWDAQRIQDPVVESVVDGVNVHMNILVPPVYGIVVVDPEHFHTLLSGSAPTCHMRDASKDRSNRWWICY